MSEDNDRFVSTEIQDGVARLIIDRPPVNVIDIATLHQMAEALQSLSEDDQIRVLLLSAAGRLFSAGVDVADHTADKVGEMIPLFDEVSRLLADFPAPTVAVVHGHALGGGCELVLCCDLAVMAEGAKIGQPEIQLAVFAPTASMRLPWLVGYRAAADLMFTGRNLTAHEALEMGLINSVVPAEELDEWVANKTAALTKLSGAALRHLKVGLKLGYGDWTRSMAELERLYLEDLMSTADAQEGLAAFMEKRPPKWQHA